MSKITPNLLGVKNKRAVFQVNPKKILKVGRSEDNFTFLYNFLISTQPSEKKGFTVKSANHEKW